MKSLINRDELRRLEKAAREKNKQHLYQWAVQFEKAISQEIQLEYEKAYDGQLGNSIDTFVLAIIYTLYRDSNVTVKPGKLEFFLDNLFKNVEKYKTMSIKPEDLQKDLARTKIDLSYIFYEHRTTEIVAIAVEDTVKREELIQEFKEHNWITLELDMQLTDDIKQKQKNIDMINMCDRLYFIGNSEVIDIYRQYAQNCSKPTIEITWKEELDATI